MRKSILTIAILGILLGTMPAFAHFTGYWEGTGTGTLPIPPVVINPWQFWGGDITADHLVFYGNWNDAATSGTFKGSLVSITSDVAVYKGYWYWDDKPDKTMGDFKMTFYWNNGVCYGEWHSFDPAGFSGTMTGDRW